MGKYREVLPEGAKGDWVRGLIFALHQSGSQTAHPSITATMSSSFRNTRSSPSILISWPAYLTNSTTSPAFSDIGRILPSAMHRQRQEARRGGEGCGGPCSSWWWA